MLPQRAVVAVSTKRLLCSSYCYYYFGWWTLLSSSSSSRHPLLAVVPPVALAFSALAAPTPISALSCRRRQKDLFPNPLSSPRRTIHSMTSTADSSSLEPENVGLTDIGAAATQQQPADDATSEDKTNDNKNSSDSPTTTTTHWRDRIAISIAKSRKIRGGNYVQIATVDPDTLEPRCRTVVFRGFLKQQQQQPNETDGDGNNNNITTNQETDVMKMITDARSNKYSEVVNDNHRNNPMNCELVWWFAKSSEQYRIRGRLDFVGPDERNPRLAEARRQQWGHLSDAAREQFYWVPPGLPLKDDDDDNKTTIPPGGRDDEHGKVLPPPDNFLLMLLSPRRCDYLRLTDNYRQVDHRHRALAPKDGDAAAAVAAENTRVVTWETQPVTP
mmetsp:Transcript_531/g.1002  ORF Transcript_531/g.1002 Transcript_531/m.1002 type:complete len:387 (-) Transcript_531:107-1267(-)